MDIINHSTSVAILGLRVTGLDAFFYLRPSLQPLFSSSLWLLSCFLNLAKPEPIEVFLFAIPLYSQHYRCYYYPATLPCWLVSLMYWRKCNLTSCMNPALPPG